MELQGLLKKKRVFKPSSKDVQRLRAQSRTDGVSAVTAGEDDSDDDDEKADGRRAGKVQVRFFVLQGGSLKYYSAKSDEPKGVLDLGVAQDFAADVSPAARAANVRLREPKVTASSSDLVSFVVALPNGMELEAAAMDAAQRDAWVYALRSVVRTARQASGGTVRASAFAAVSADERLVVEDHKRRIFREARFLY